LRPEDPFCSASDDEGRDDPFTEPDGFFSASDDEGGDGRFTEPDGFFSASDDEGGDDRFSEPDGFFSVSDDEGGDGRFSEPDGFFSASDDEGGDDRFSEPDAFDPDVCSRSGAGRAAGSFAHGRRVDRRLVDLRLLVAGAALVAAVVAAGVVASLSNGGEVSTTPDASPVPTAVPSTVPPTTLGGPAEPAPTSIAANGADAPRVPDPAPDAPDALLGCDDRSGDDPHGLVRVDEITERLSFCGEETWQVFVCSARESDRADRVAYVDDVLGEAAEWFEWASAGQYDIDFSAGDDTRAVSGGTAGPQECFEEVLQNQWSESRSGALVLVDEAALDPLGGWAGVGTCGYIGSTSAREFGESGRMVAIAVHARGDQSAIAVHELGHAQCWPHSYSGETGSEYDNPADVLSSGQNWPVGTIAVNRYASGWIHPDAVRVHRSSTGAYTLSPCCSGGVQMLALLPQEASEQPVDFNRRWWHLEVRDPQDDWERGLADTEVGTQLGVSVHWIDQSVGLGPERRQAQVGNQAGFEFGVPVRFGRLRAVGSEFCLHSDQPRALLDCSSAHHWRVEVSASQAGGLSLTLTPGS